MNKSMKRRFEITFFSLLRTKLRNYVHKSIYRYLIASLMLAYGFKILDMFISQTFYSLSISIFSLLMLVSGTGIYLSSIIIPILKKDRVIWVTFSSDSINIEHEIDGRTEELNWSWIQKCEETNDNYYLRTGSMQWRWLWLKKSALMEEEEGILRELLVQHRLIK